MMIFKAHKIVATLPVTLEADTLYIVRVGVGFDLYCTDTTGSIAYKVNSLTANEILNLLKTVDGSGSGLDADTLDSKQSTDFSLATFNEEIVSGQKNLTVTDAKYQFLSCASVQIINLPNPVLVANKEFTIINTGLANFSIFENGINTNILLGEGGLIECFCNGVDWQIFLDYQPMGTSSIGVQGLSAYEVALNNGFVGTEQEWVNKFFYEYFIIPLGFPNIDAQLSTDEKLLGEYFPFNFTIQTIILTLTTAPTGSNFIVNLKKNGVSIFNTLLSVDAGEKTSVTATTPYVLNTNIINQGDVLSFSVTQVGATIKGQYPVIVMSGVRI